MELSGNSDGIVKCGAGTATGIGLVNSDAPLLRTIGEQTDDCFSISKNSAGKLGLRIVTHDW